MVELFFNALVAVKSAHGWVLERPRDERGATMVEYALLVGLIAMVAFLTVYALGQGITGLFGNANTCITGVNSTNC